MTDETDLLVAEEFSCFDTVEPPDTWGRAVAIGMQGDAPDRSVRSAWLIAAAVVFTIAAGATIVAGVGDGRSGQQVETPPADRSDPPAPSTSEASPSDDSPDAIQIGTVTTFEPPPIEPRLAAAVLWTGTELVMWGGYDVAACCGVPSPDPALAFADGAALDPTTGEWRVLTGAPIGPSFGVSQAVWTDRGLVVARDQEVALWDPTDGTTGNWQPLPDAPGLIRDLEVVGSTVVSVSAGGVFDLGSETWRPLPDPPVELGWPQTVRVGEEVVAVGLSGGPGCNELGNACQMEAIGYDPMRDSWRTLPALPLGFTWHTFRIASDGDRLVVATGRGHGAVYDQVADAWGDLAHLPGETSDWFEMPVAATDGLAVVAMADRIAVRSADGRWRGVPDEAEPVPFGSQESALRWAELVGGPDGAVFAASLEPLGGGNEVRQLDLE